MEDLLTGPSGRVLAWTGGIIGIPVFTYALVYLGFWRGLIVPAFHGSPPAIATLAIIPLVAAGLVLEGHRKKYRVQHPCWHARCGRESVSPSAIVDRYCARHTTHPTEGE